MARTKHAELPDCQPVPLKFKEVSLENGAGNPLCLCRRCEGDGRICTAEKRSIDKHGSTVFETLKEFAGKYRRQRERSGWVVKSDTCPDCKGAGLICKKGAAQ
jgi:hypothetical protein